MADSMRRFVGGVGADVAGDEFGGVLEFGQRGRGGQRHDGIPGRGQQEAPARVGWTRPDGACGARDGVARVRRKDQSVLSSAS